MRKFIEPELIIHKNIKGDGWVHDWPRPKYWMAAHKYALAYLDFINSEAIDWNKKYATNTIRAAIVKVNFWFHCDLKSEKALGLYCRSNSWDFNAIIKIDIRAHNDNWEKIKETIRHELCHAIEHQVYGNGWMAYHGELWQKIAKIHNVDTRQYEEV